MKTIEKDVNKRALVDARKNSVGLADNLVNVASAGEVIHGILNTSPAALTTGLAMKGFAALIKHLNDPNTAIKNMFEKVDKFYTPEQATVPIPEQKLLPAPKTGAPKVSNNIPIELPSKTPLDQAVVDAQGAKKLNRPGTSADYVGDNNKLPPTLMSSKSAGEVFSELDNASAGKRLFINGEVSGVKSSFPQWIPEDLRSKSLLNSVQQHILDGTTPKSGKVAQLYDVVHKEIIHRNENDFGDFMSNLQNATP